MPTAFHNVSAPTVSVHITNPSEYTSTQLALCANLARVKTAIEHYIYHITFETISEAKPIW